MIKLLIFSLLFMGYGCEKPKTLAERGCVPVNVSHWVRTVYFGKSNSGPFTVISYVCEDGTMEVKKIEGFFSLEDLTKGQDDES